MSVAVHTDLLTAHPLFGLALTVGIYLLAVQVHTRLGRPPLLHPVLTSVALVAFVIWQSGISYAQYFAQASPLHHGLSVLVVLLAVPLARQMTLIRAAAVPVATALVIGSAIAILTALAPPVGLGARHDLSASLVSKSATAAVAVGISERLGGVAGLTAMTAVLTGLCGAVIGPWLLATAGVRDERAAGFALGVAAHAIGTARAFQISETAGAFASMGMVLNAVLTVALAPLAMSQIP